MQQYNVEHHFVLKSRRAFINGALSPACVEVKNGRIVSISDYGKANWQGLPVDDLADSALIPGLVDTHVHINEPGRTQWEGFNSATQAAAAGGITTVVDMPLNCSPVTTTKDALAIKLASLDGKLWVDCGFWGGVTPDNLADLDDLLRAGVLGVKSFTIDSGIDEFPPVEAQHLSAAIKILAKYNVPYLIHAELDGSNQQSAAIGCRYQSFLASRPKQWENDAIAMMIDLAQQAADQSVKANIHIVHLSSADAITAIEQARQQGLQISAETCPHYLTLFAEAIPDGKTLFKCCPPIREDENRQRLWQGLTDGVIDFIVSDHSPCTPQLKHIDSGDIERAWGGISSLQFGLSIIWTEAKRRNLPLEQVVTWMATNPARFAGLSHLKGQIAVGHDADLVVFDDGADYVITPDMIKYRHKVTPYEGRRVSGVVQRTLVRGFTVFANGNMVAKPIGNIILNKHE